MLKPFTVLASFTFAPPVMASFEDYEIAGEFAAGLLEGGPFGTVQVVGPHAQTGEVVTLWRYERKLGTQSAAS